MELFSKNTIDKEEVYHFFIKSGFYFSARNKWIVIYINIIAFPKRVWWR